MSIARIHARTTQARPSSAGAPSLVEVCSGVARYGSIQYLSDVPPMLSTPMSPCRPIDRETHTTSALRELLLD